VSEKVLQRAFQIAAVYNVAWGATVAVFPNLFFQLFQIEPINYPFIMSGLGMCIGLYGYGYWVVARDLRKYPQLVMIGFLGKTIGPVGWLWTVINTSLPLRTMWTNVFNDLIWLPFFIAYFVWYRRHAHDLSPDPGR
jgi:small multidrug resistance pump